MTMTDTQPTAAAARPTILSSSMILPLIDTHTHFDAPVFDEDRDTQSQQAWTQGVRHVVLVGYVYRHFTRLYQTQHIMNVSGATASPQAHVALGLHPFYIEQHSEAHLVDMAQMLDKSRPLAIGEIGLDTYSDTMKQPAVFAKQQHFFRAQLDMAVQHQLPVMLHIRKAHAEALAILKSHAYNAHQLGGIAHSFSGGEQEAKAFVKLGFKLGITGQISNPNAKKLRRAIQAAVAMYGTDCLVIETDCPDMTPMMCQNAKHHTATDAAAYNQHDRNVPANLPYVLLSLSELLQRPTTELAAQLWHNSCYALQVTWSYSDIDITRS